MPSGPKKDEPTSLAAKIDRLFATMHPAGRGPLTNDEVADAIRAHGGPTISSQYLWQLRKGRRDNPTRQHIQALAAYFHVPVGYFFDEDFADTYDADMELLNALRQDDIRDIATRAAKLPPAGRQAVLAVIDSTQQLHNAQT